MCSHLEHKGCNLLARGVYVCVCICVKGWVMWKAPRGKPAQVITSVLLWMCYWSKTLMPGDPAAQTTHTHREADCYLCSVSVYTHGPKSVIWCKMQAVFCSSNSQSVVQGPLKLPSGPVTQGPLLRRAGAPFKAVLWLSWICKLLLNKSLLPFACKLCSWS